MEERTLRDLDECERVSITNGGFLEMKDSRKVTVDHRSSRHLFRNKQRIHQTSYYKQQKVAETTLSVKSMSVLDRAKFVVDPDPSRLNIFVRSNPVIINGRICN